MPLTPALFCAFITRVMRADAIHIVTFSYMPQRLATFRPLRDEVIYASYQRCQDHTPSHILLRLRLLSFVRQRHYATRSRGRHYCWLRVVLSIVFATDYVATYASCRHDYYAYAAATASCRCYHYMPCHTPLHCFTMLCFSFSAQARRARRVLLLRCHVTAIVYYFEPRVTPLSHFHMTAAYFTIITLSDTADYCRHCLHYCRVTIMPSRYASAIEGRHINDPYGLLPR